MNHSGTLPTVPPSVIYLVFYEYIGSASIFSMSWWINKVTQWTTRSPYIHVDVFLYYPKTTSYLIRALPDVGIESIPIENGKLPTYARTTYKNVGIGHLTMNGFERFVFANTLFDIALKPNSYNSWGLYLFWFPSWLKFKRPNSWFCSEMIAYAFQQSFKQSSRTLHYRSAKVERNIEPFLTLRPQATSPGGIYKLIHETYIGHDLGQPHGGYKPLSLPR